MKIETHADRDINFFWYARAAMRWPTAKVVQINTQNGMKLNVAHVWNGKRFYITLMKGNAEVSVVELMRSGFTEDGRMICAPHSFTKAKFRGQGYVKQIYSWLLDNDIVLRSCGRQTLSSRQLWLKLSKMYNLRAYNKRKKQYCDLALIDRYDVTIELSKR